MRSLDRSSPPGRWSLSATQAGTATTLATARPKLTHNVATMPGRHAVAALLLLTSLAMTSHPAAQTRTIYWGDEVPAGWTGQWSADLLTVPERTNWTRTMSTLQLHEWIAALKLRTEFLHVETMFVSRCGRRHQS